MTWERFHYVCRRHMRGGLGQADFALSAQFYKSGENSDLYGPPAAVGSLPRYIVSQLESMTDADRRTAAISMYAEMDFSMPTRETLRVKRALAYIALVMMTYLVLASIYTEFVFPSFLPFFEEQDMPRPQAALTYLKYSHVPIGAAALLGVIVGFTIHQLNVLLAFKHLPTTFHNRSLAIPGKVKRTYMKLMELITYPLEDSRRSTALTAKIDELVESGHDLREELPILIKVHWDEFARLSDRYVRILTAAIGVIVVLSVVFLLSSAYAPIFVSGDVI